MSRHATRRAPKRNGGFSWGRFSTTRGDFVTWCLYRRDRRRALHKHMLTFYAHGDRAVIAAHLRPARRLLRDKVHHIDPHAMGMAA